MRIDNYLIIEDIQEDIITTVSNYIKIYSEFSKYSAYKRTATDI